MDKPVVIVTGASRGLGAAVARWLGAMKVNVALVARSQDGIGSVAGDVAHLGGNALPLAADVSDARACRQVIHDAIDRFLRIDAVINNAATITPLSPIASANEDAWRHAIEVNLMGPFYLSKFALPFLQESRGRIINISSGAAHTAIPGAGAYCVSKAGLTHLTRILAAEHPEITPISVRPGVVDTAMQTRLRREGGQSLETEQHSYYMNLKKTGALEPPEIPGRSIAWLALHAPAAMSGEFRSYDDPDIMAPAKAMLGGSLPLKFAPEV